MYRKEKRTNMELENKEIKIFNWNKNFENRKKNLFNYR